MARWAAFAGVTVAVLVLLLALARASQSILTSAATEVDDRERPPAGEGTRESAAEYTPDENVEAATDPPSADADGEGIGPGRARFVRYGPPSSSEHLSTPALLGNVAISQGLLAAIMIGGLWYAQIPLDALGISTARLGSQLALGIGFGIALAVANAAGAAIASAYGINPSEELRRVLAPDTTEGWALLLLVVLPVIAGFEELLFRAALVGAFSAGFGVSPWVLAVLSAGAFALGHGAQGPAGIVVTGLLGFVLAAGFVLSGSLLVVVVAHYLVNAVEFVVYEGLGLDPI